MAAPKYTRTANMITFEGDQSFTFILMEKGVKRARFFGIDWYLDPNYKYPLTDTTIEFPNFNGYPQIFYAKGSGLSPLEGGIFLYETSPHYNNNYVDENQIGGVCVVAL